MHYNITMRSSRVTILLWKIRKYSVLSGGVSVFLNLLSGMQIATFRVILSQFACFPLPYLSTLCHKQHDYRKEGSERKTCVLIFSVSLYAIILILRQIQWDIIINTYRSPCKVPINNSCQILMKPEFFRTNFPHILKHRTSWKSVQWEPNCSTRSDSRVDWNGEANSRYVYDNGSNKCTQVY